MQDKMRSTDEFVWNSLLLSQWDTNVVGQAPFSKVSGIGMSVEKTGVSVSK